MARCVICGVGVAMLVISTIPGSVRAGGTHGATSSQGGHGAANHGGHFAIQGHFSRASESAVVVAVASFTPTRRFWSSGREGSCRRFLK